MNITRIVITKKTIKARKDHLCFVCSKSIPKGTDYIYDKVIDFIKRFFTERRRHTLCFDPDNLQTTYELDRFLDIRSIVRSWKKG